MAIGKGELVDRVATTTGFPKAQVSRTVDTMLEQMQQALSQGESVTLRGFGTFTSRERAARTGRNPRTGEEIAIAARTAIGFKASAPSSRGGQQAADGATAPAEAPRRGGRRSAAASS